MYQIGQPEIDAVAKVIQSKKLFRYDPASQCDRFENRYAEYLGVKNVRLTASGTTALSAAIMALGIGPGDEVLVPAQTYMASAAAVLTAGAIPVVVDIDESTTISPEALADAIGPRTRAVMPVHMWGVACDMDAILRIAEKHKLLVIEDACQAVGGAYEGRMLGSLGHAGAFSFNFFKNMSCGEGGAVVMNDDDAFKRAANAVDCCSFYWNGQRNDGYEDGFTANSSRASEIEGAILNEQLNRLPGMIETMRAQKKRILRETAGALTAAPCYSLDYECGASNIFTFATGPQADTFAATVGGTVLSKTGRHVYTNWDPILEHRGAHHPAMNPFNFAENRECRMSYTADMCAASLRILDRLVRVPNHPDRTEAETTALIEKLNAAGSAANAREPAASRA
jgi:dTDP-4-amino-4,6-dideoxygalactose transaminase